MYNWLMLFLAFLLVGLNAMFVAAEFAWVKVMRVRIEMLADSGNGRAKLALFGINNLDAYLSVCQLGITLASLAAYALSQAHDVWAFHFWRRKTGGRMLWLRNNASTLVSQFIDTLVFCSIAFIGVFEVGEVAQIFLSTYLVKALVALLDTPFIYAGRAIYRRRVKDGNIDAMPVDEEKAPPAA